MMKSRKKLLTILLSFSMMVVLIGFGENSKTYSVEKERSIKIRVTIGEHQLTATLIDNATTRSLIAKFPLTIRMRDLFSREMCHNFSEPLPAYQAEKSGYEVGDLSYWTPAHSLVIFYKQNGEVISNLQKIGHFDSGVEIFKQTGDVDVMFELMGEHSKRTEGKAVKIKLLFNNEEVIVKLNDNPTSRDFLTLLPLTLGFQDYAGTEKISYLPRKLSTEKAPSGFDPSVGDFTLYAPWGNIAIFYKDFGFASGLISLGKIESGIDKLAKMRGDFTVRIIKNDLEDE